MLLFIMDGLLLMREHNHFKTSHVIVYRKHVKHLLFVKAFQNISCYCLSEYTLDPEESARIFQNISCYCLSILYLQLQPEKIYFKTSHVIVYHY